MIIIPLEIEIRRDEYCQAKQLQVVDLIGFGVDGYVWQTDRESVVKVCRYKAPFDSELAVYQRLSGIGLRKLQGFEIPWLLDHDAGRWVLELSFVSPPFVLDFAAVSLGKAPSEMTSPEWLAEKRRMFKSDWPDVQRLLDGLRLYGIHFPDVHLGNIRVRK